MENYKTQVKVTEDDTNRNKAILCSWFGRFNILPKAMYRLSANPIKISEAFFIELEKSILKFIWKYKKKKKNLNNQSNLEKEQSWTPWLHSYSKQNSIILAKKKKNRQIDQENRSENPETSQLTEDQSTYHKGDKNIPRVKKSSISGAVKTGQNHVEQCI